VAVCGDGEEAFEADTRRRREFRKEEIVETTEMRKRKFWIPAVVVTLLRLG
jgi:hypothetical protein